MTDVLGRSGGGSAVVSRESTVPQHSFPLPLGSLHLHLLRDRYFSWAPSERLMIRITRPPSELSAVEPSRKDVKRVGPRPSPIPSRLRSAPFRPASPGRRPGPCARFVTRGLFSFRRGQPCLFEPRLLSSLSPRHPGCLSGDSRQGPVWVAARSLVAVLPAPSVLTVGPGPSLRLTFPSCDRMLRGNPDERLGRRDP